jgi:hypothetical protein
MSRVPRVSGIGLIKFLSDAATSRCARLGATCACGIRSGRRPPFPCTMSLVPASCAKSCGTRASRFRTSSQTSACYDTKVLAGNIPLRGRIPTDSKHTKTPHGPPSGFLLFRAGLSPLAPMADRASGIQLIDASARSAFARQSVAISVVLSSTLTLAWSGPQNTPPNCVSGIQHPRQQRDARIHRTGAQARSALLGSLTLPP